MGEVEHPESNRNPRRDLVHLPLMVCSTNLTARTTLRRCPASGPSYEICALAVIQPPRCDTWQPCG